MISKKYFLIDTLSNFTYSGSKFLFNLLIYSLLIDKYTLDQYGVYIFFASILGQFDFLHSGFSTSLLRYLPLYKKKSDISNLVFLVSLIYFIMGLMLSCIIFFLAKTGFFQYFNLNSWEEYIDFLVILFPLIWFFKAFSFALDGLKDYRAGNFLNLIFLFLELVTIYFLVNKDFKLHSILFIVLLILLSKNISHFLAFFIRHNINFNYINKREIVLQFKKIKKFSSWNFITSLSGVLINQFDKTLVLISLGTTALPIYYGLNQFIRIFTIVSSMINNAVIPHFSEKINASSKKTFNDIVINGTSITTFISIVLAGFLVLFSDVIFELLSKEYLRGYSFTMVICLTLYILVSSRSFLTKLFLCLEHNAKILSVLSLITAIIYPIVFLLLTESFDLTGAIFSPIISHIIVFPLWVNKLFKNSGLKFKAYLFSFSKTFFSSILIFGFFYYINNTMIMDISIAHYFIETVIIATSIYIVNYERMRLFLSFLKLK